MPRTGPTSPAGKVKSSLNSIKHGIHSKGFLPCKGQGCPFIALCDLVAENGSETFNSIPHGVACPCEVNMYEMLAHGYAQEIIHYTEETKDLVHELIMLQIRQERRRKLSALEGDIIREGVPRSNHGGVALSQRYRRSIIKRQHELLAALFPRVS